MGREEAAPAAPQECADGVEEEQLPAYSEDGVDLTLIRWMLSLTPAERLDTLQQFVNAFRESDDAAACS